MTDQRITALLEPVVAAHGLELEEVDVKPAGKRRVVRVVVDGDGPRGRGPLLDDIAAATRDISETLDGSDVMGSAPYTLEVSSRGVSRPLTLPRHWRRNRGRLVTVTRAGVDQGGEQVVGRIGASDDVAVQLEIDGVDRDFDYADIGRALIQVELNRSRDETEEED